MLHGCMTYVSVFLFVCIFCLQAEDGIRYLVRSRGLGDVYKRQLHSWSERQRLSWLHPAAVDRQLGAGRRRDRGAEPLSLIHI